MINLITYLFIWILSISTSNWYYTWMSLEMSNWLLLTWLPSNIMLTYIIWQSLSSVVLIYGWMIISSSLMSLLAIMMKTGMPPFNSWVMSINWSWLGWALFMTFHKTLPFMIMMMMLTNKSWLLLWPAIALATLYSNTTMTSMMLISTISDSMWMLLSTSWNQFWLYSVIYSVCWFSWMYMFTSWQTATTNGPIQSIMFLILLGLPPFIFFFLKLLIWLNMSVFTAVILGVNSWLMLFLYWIWLSMSLYKTSMMTYTSNAWLITTIFMSTMIITM